MPFVITHIYMSDGIYIYNNNGIVYLMHIYTTLYTAVTSRSRVDTLASRAQEGPE